MVSTCLLVSLLAWAASLSGASPAPAWNRTNPDSAIYIPTGPNDLCNQQVVGIVTSQEAYLVTWTMASREGSPDQRVVTCRSVDHGKTWSDPLVVDRDRINAPGAASYGVLYQSPKSGRIYSFYCKNAGTVQVRRDVTGFLRWAYSDDDGQSWQRVHARFDMGKGESSDPKNNIPGDWVGIYAPHSTSAGDVLFSFARYGLKPGRKGYESWMTEVFFLRMENVASEPDPARLQFTVLPQSPTGLRIAREDDPQMFWGNEPSWIELSDGRLVTAIRTRNGAVYYAQSHDRGRTWTQPEPMRYTDGGPVLQQPNAPCPMIRLADGRILLMFNNQPPANRFGPRNPVYLVVGRESLASRQPIEFGEPVKLMEVDQTPSLGTTYLQIASYSSLVEAEREVLLFYNDCKHWVLFKRIPRDLLRPRFPSR